MGLISNGTTIFDAGSMASGFGGSMTFIKKLTASNSATLSFVDGTSSVVLDNTYKEYLFTFNNIHPITDNVYLSFQGNKAGGSGYNETITSTVFQAYNFEAAENGVLGYRTDLDKAQGTTFQQLTQNTGTDNDQGVSGYLHLYDPSSTTFVKHFTSRFNTHYYQEISIDVFCAGYFNETDAIDEIQFKFNSGNIDSGDICLYGIG
jgi:hypothetical protein|tara:strand:- start:67 stop:681 length:615 start_codon:yes stop_codon:yes gene_type:complete